MLRLWAVTCNPWGSSWTVKLTIGPYEELKAGTKTSRGDLSHLPEVGDPSTTPSARQSDPYGLAKESAMARPRHQPPLIGWWLFDPKRASSEAAEPPERVFLDAPKRFTGE
jgi:hypothetical protein